MIRFTAAILTLLFALPVAAQQPGDILAGPVSGTWQTTVLITPPTADTIEICLFDEVNVGANADKANAESCQPSSASIPYTGSDPNHQGEPTILFQTVFLLNGGDRRLVAVSYDAAGNWAVSDNGRFIDQTPPSKPEIISE